MPYAKYFNYLPTVPYETFDGTNRYKVVTDIFKRTRATLEARTDKAIFYNYRVVEGQLPEHVAYNYYGSADYHWVVLLMNDIRDPQWCWPLDSFTFERFIVNKYGSTETASTQVLHYETKELKAGTTDDNYTAGDIVLNSGIRCNFDFSYSYTGTVDGNLPGQTYEFTSDQAVNTVYALTYEDAQNNERADIILLRRELLSEFVETFENLVVEKR